MEIGKKTDIWIIVIGVVAFLPGCLLTGEEGVARSFHDSDIDTRQAQNTDPQMANDTDTGPLDLGETMIYSTNGLLGYAACYGDRVAWSVYHETGNEIQIWDVSNNIQTIQTQISTTYFLTMSEQVIAWSNYDTAAEPFTAFDVFYSVLPASTPLAVDQTALDELSPRVDGMNIVFQQNKEAAAPQLRAGSLSTGNLESLGEMWDGTYDISGELTAAAFSGSNITVKSLTGGADIQIPTTSPAKQVRISGETVVWYERMNFGKGSAVYAHSIQTGKLQAAEYGLKGDPVGLDVDGNFAVYGGTKTIAGEDVTGIFLYNITTNRAREVTSGYERLYDVCIGGGRIAWLIGSEPHSDPAKNTWEIYSALLPE